MKVDYDNKAMIPVLINGCELGMLTSNIDTSAESGSLYVTWYSAENCNDDGAMFTITWQALEENGEYAINLVYDEKDVCNSNKEEVFVKSESGSVLILDRPVGDIYKDGEVNMKDIVYFARWFNSQESLDNGQSLAADILYDDILDVKDLTSLAQRLCETLNSTSLRMMPLAKGLNRTAMLASDNVVVDNPFSIIVSDAEIMDDENVVLHVGGDNCLGVAAFRFRIEVPDGYDVLGVQPAQLLNSGSFAYNPETHIVTWYSSEDKVLNGELFSIKLRRSEEGLLPAMVDLSYIASDCFSVKDYLNTNLQTKAGKINKKLFTTVDSIFINENNIIISFSNSLEENVTVFVAFYNENGQMEYVTSDTILCGNKQFWVHYPSDVVGLNCKCFLLSESELLPVAGSFLISS